MSNDPSRNPAAGGDISDMAVDGAKMPKENPTQENLPNVPNPHHAAESKHSSLGQATPAGAASNAVDIPRGPGDPGAGLGEAISGTGHTMPGTIDDKNLKAGGGNPVAKGSDRYDKHSRDGGSALDQGAIDDKHAMEPAPGEENDSQDAIRARKDG